MEFKGLIQILEKELALYVSLKQLAVKKLEIIKKNDIPALNEIMQKEQKHITSITILEKERIRELERLFPDRKYRLPTIRECVKMATQAEKKTIRPVRKACGYFT